MNKQDLDILKTIKENGFINQRVLSETANYSIGLVNQTLKQLIKEEYLTNEYELTTKANDLFLTNKPKNAIILAAGFGMRMVPINTEIPKGLINLYDEPLIERLIKQLQNVGINKIYVVVGFLKEKFEYLIDKYNVELIVNKDYAIKNNMYSLYKARKYLSNTYIIPSDIWCKNNPFSENELYSWYMVSDEKKISQVYLNRKNELVLNKKNEIGNKMFGISYLTENDSKIIKSSLETLCANQINDNEFWEKALFVDNKMFIYGKMVSKESTFEIDTFEQLYDLDHYSNQVKSETLNIVCKALNCGYNDIKEITCLKKGMTNRSFLFKVNNKKYIMRIPGEGTDQLINRKEEASVYNVIKAKNICDNIIYINPSTGYKITEFVEGARCCDPENIEDVKLCMDRLKKFHALKLKVDHEFDIFRLIEFYETLWDNIPSAYSDYEQTKKNVLSLKSIIDNSTKEYGLTHIDAVPDNFLIVEENNKVKDIRLIDWEYAGMQDQHVDIAMFAIYSLYDREQVEQLIDIYFDNKCPLETRIKIYCYISCCGLLWSNWCEYKRNLGVEFGEYSLKQYRFAKDYYRIAIDLINKNGGKLNA